MISSAACVFAASLSCLLVLPEAGLAPNLAGLDLLMRGLDMVELSPESFLDRVLLHEDGGCLDTKKAWKLPSNADDISSWVVLFCKTEVGNCTQFASTFEQLYLRTVGPSDKIRFGTFDCSMDEASEALCKDFHAEAYPVVGHFQKGELVGKWISDEKTALLPWLFNEIRATSPQNVSRGQMIPQALTKTTAKKQADDTNQADRGRSLAPPAASVSHLKYLHDVILMEDCLFSRLFSGMILTAILGKCAWILITGSESDVSVLY